MVGYDNFSIFKMGYENFFDYVKVSSALVPRIKNDHSLSPKHSITATIEANVIYFIYVGELELHSALTYH